MSGTEYFPDGVTRIDPWFYDTQVKDLSASGRGYVLTEHGITGGDRIWTGEIQALIDRIAAEGGGVLTVPAGTFRTGALFFRPGVDLYLCEGAVLLGSDDISDYPVIDTRIEGESCRYFAALINADRADGFTLSGKGTVDGNGLKAWKAFWLRRDWNPQCTNKDEQRPRLICISNSSGVTVAGVRLQNAQFWTCHLYRCSRVRVLGCSIYSPYEPVKAPSTDAIDLDVCCDVLVKGCEMHVNDDAVALKGGKGPWADTAPENGSNERILVEDCHYRFCHGCLTLGSEAVHCKNVILRRIRVDSGYNLLWLKMRPDTPQRYEHLLVEDVEGRVNHFFTLLPWTQFYDLKGRKDLPLSTAEDITLRRCRITCDVMYNAEPMPEQYRVSRVCARDLQVQAKEKGDPFWEKERREDA